MNTYFTICNCPSTKIALALSRLVPDTVDDPVEDYRSLFLYLKELIVKSKEQIKLMGELAYKELRKPIAAGIKNLERAIYLSPKQVVYKGETCSLKMKEVMACETIPIRQHYLLNQLCEAGINQLIGKLTKTLDTYKSSSGSKVSKNTACVLFALKSSRRALDYFKAKCPQMIEADQTGPLTAERPLPGTLKLDKNPKRICPRSIIPVCPKIGKPSECAEMELDKYRNGKFGMDNGLNGKGKGNGTGSGAGNGSGNGNGKENCTKKPLTCSTPKGAPKNICPKGAKNTNFCSAYGHPIRRTIYVKTYTDYFAEPKNCLCTASKLALALSKSIPNKAEEQPYTDFKALFENLKKVLLNTDDQIIDLIGPCSDLSKSIQLTIKNLERAISLSPKPKPKDGERCENVYEVTLAPSVISQQQNILNKLSEDGLDLLFAKLAGTLTTYASSPNTDISKNLACVIYALREGLRVLGHFNNNCSPVADQPYPRIRLCLRPPGGPSTRPQYRRRSSAKRKTTKPRYNRKKGEIKHGESETTTNLDGGQTKLQKNGILINEADISSSVEPAAKSAKLMPFSGDKTTANDESISGDKTTANAENISGDKSTANAENISENKTSPNAKSCSETSLGKCTEASTKKGRNVGKSKPDKKNKLKSLGTETTETLLPDCNFTYQLSDPKFINLGYTILPTEEILYQQDIYYAHFVEENKPRFGPSTTEKYATGIPFTESNKKLGWERVLYPNGQIAIEYHFDKESKIGKYTVYGPGPAGYTVLGVFDTLGYGIVYGPDVSIKLSYSQRGGIFYCPKRSHPLKWTWLTSKISPKFLVYQDTNLPIMFKVSETINTNKSRAKSVKTDSTETKSNIGGKSNINTSNSKKTNNNKKITSINEASKINEGDIAQKEYEPITEIYDKTAFQIIKNHTIIDPIHTTLKKQYPDIIFPMNPIVTKLNDNISLTIKSQDTIYLEMQALGLSARIELGVVIDKTNVVKQNLLNNKDNIPGVYTISKAMAPPKSKSMLQILGILAANKIAYEKENRTAKLLNPIRKTLSRSMLIHM